MQDLPLIALVGEPNAGKSTLMNKIAGRQLAVTSPVAGTTRDRQYVDADWNGRAFSLVDTAGLSFNDTGELEAALLEQIEIAVAEADVIVFVVDGKTHPENLDRKTVLKFRKTKKPVIVAINKLDSPKNLEEILGEFQSLGIKQLFGVSGLTGRGMGDLLDAMVEALPPEKELPPRPESEIAVAIVGKPNVGKSSLFNAILKEKRVVVSSIPGTTRTAIDTQTEIDGTNYTFIDTAGLKRKDYRQGLPDRYSGFQTFKSIRRSDIAILVISALEPISKQDQHIAAEIIDMAKGCIIVVNKMDQYNGEESSLRDHISYHFPFLWYSPLFFTSAVTDQNIEEVIAAIKPIADNRKKVVPQEAIDKILAYSLEKYPPKLMLDQRKPKVYGLTQIGSEPPTFELYVNFSAAISTQYRRALQKAIAKYLDFWGTPVELKFRDKDNS